MPKVASLLESALYVADVARSAEFYRSLLELEVLQCDESFAALQVTDRQLLLLFRKGVAAAPKNAPQATHRGDGRLHLAFAIAEVDLPSWEKRLAERRIACAGRVRWPRGGESLYFRDPDEHLVELATPGVWPVY